MSPADLRGQFIWHELMTPNAQAAADFYSSVLPWRTEVSTVPGYTLWMSGADGVAGLTPQPQTVRDSDTPPSWLMYIAAPDVDATAEAAQRLGGKLLKAPTDIPGIGRFAVLSDPQGAAFAVFMPAMAAPPRATPAPAGRFSWHELATIDPQGALAFYAQLFGWTRGPAHDMGAGGLYQIIEHAGVQIGGMHVLQDPSKPPRWLGYVRVERLDETLAAVRAHGGRVLQGPHVVPGGDRVAQVVDPQGGVIALHELPLPAAAAAPPARAPARPTPARKKTAPKPAARKAPAKSKPAAKRPAKRSAKRTAKRAVKPAAKRAAKPAARRTGKRAVGLATARKKTAGRAPTRKTRAGARPKKSARRTARRR